MFNDKNKERKIFKKLAILFFLLFIIAASFSGGLIYANKSKLLAVLADKETVLLGKILNKYTPAKAGKLSQDVDFSLFWQVWDLLEKDYVNKDKLNEKEMFYGAISGLVASLHDPYTIFMSPKETIDFENDLAGTFEGIGAEIGIKNEILTVIAPLAGMPAEKAGLLAGDKIYAINGEPTSGMTIDQAVSKIRGPKDTEVTLTISRDGMEKAKDVKIVRGLIVVKSVKTNSREDGILVIAISNFNNDTEGLFNQAVRQAIEGGSRGIVLDLRNNPGGYLDTAIEVASEWIEDGVIVTEKFNQEKKNEYLARGKARLKDYPTVVLVNQGSASASEIVAGALQDTNRAKIVGKQTFGKGSVQLLEDLKDGSAIKITVAQWLTPKGSNINEQGIVPDFEVDLTNDDYDKGLDPQMDQAIKLLIGE